MRYSLPRAQAIFAWARGYRARDLYSPKVVSQAYVWYSRMRYIMHKAPRVLHFSAFNFIMTCLCNMYNHDNTSKVSSIGNLRQEQLNRNAHKAGLCVICSCTRPMYGEPIENCTAPERMNTCFGTKLGYSVFKVDSNLSTRTLEKLLYDLSRLQIPPECAKNFRFLFYFFGHGMEKEICLSDGNFKRSRIIEELQKISRDRFKIALLDSCRHEDTSPTQKEATGYDREVTMNEPIQDTVSTVTGQSQWEDHNDHRLHMNTLVISATNFRSKAYYMDSDAFPEMKGCGLVTHFFTTLAPKMNQPIMAVLAEVRKEVDEFFKKNQQHFSSLPPQVLAYEDMLMGNGNLLAESKGNGKI